MICPVSIYTLGCKLNQLEGEALADSFRNAGFPLVPWGMVMDKPGIIIINTCTVTSKADQKSRHAVRKALRENPESSVIVTGCYAELDPGDIDLLASADGRRLFVLGGGGNGAAKTKSALLHLPEYLKEAMANENDASLLPQFFEYWIHHKEDGSPFNFKPEEFTFHSRGYLKIQDGCDNTCAYCRVRLARGPSVSMVKEAVLRELLSFEAKGCAELMITGVNIGQYRDSGFDLAGLLQYLLEGSRTIALRLSSLEPEMIDEKLAAALAHPRIRPHFHLSVQSGSGTILQKMGRIYSPQKAEEGAALLRSAKDNPFLACDIIAGFPGETETEFAQTLALCEKINFAWIHAFPFSKRPGTPAFSLKGQVCERDVTQRVKTLTTLALQGRRGYAQTWLGKELPAVVENGKAAQGQFRAVSDNYLKLLVNYSGEPPLPGSSVRCIPVSLCEGADGEKPDAVCSFKF